MAFKRCAAATALVVSIADGALVTCNMTAGTLVPGTGMKPDEIKPYKETYADGYMAIDCAKDSMLEFGDKHGDGKFNYKLGGVSGVSIIHYTEMIPKLEQKPMTHEVCFSFCRSIKDMLFFGIHNGRDCYCAPYYDPMESDSSSCDAPCDGDSATMCGGKTKSSIFSLHACNDAAENLKKAAAQADEAAGSLGTLAKKITAAADLMQSKAETLQKAFGKVGDGAASNLCQEAKAFAGECVHSANDGAKLSGKTLDSMAEADGFKGNDVDSEKLLGKVLSSTEKSEALAEDLAKLDAQIEPDDSKAEASEKLYYPVMYFVDKKFEDVPATCGGKAAGKPALTTFAGCAAACDDAVNSGCQAFSFLADGDKQGLCFLFSKVETATYYTGCKKSFLQSKVAAGADQTKCMVKFSEYNGMNIKPKADGSCKTCLKEAKKADRCFE